MQLSRLTTAIVAHPFSATLLLCLRFNSIRRCWTLSRFKVQLHFAVQAARAAVIGVKTELALTFFPSPPDCSFSVFALLASLPTEITSKKQQLLYKRDLSLLDASGCVVKLTIWVSDRAAAGRPMRERKVRLHCGVNAALTALPVARRYVRPLLTHLFAAH